MQKGLTMRWLGWILLIGCLIGLGVTGTVMVTGQCNVRADWGTTTVISGDTIHTIAQRFKITEGELQEANCLTDSNLTPGQPLRVPATSLDPGNILLVRVLHTIFTGATFQPFEHGFMIWREDTGEIGVYVGTYGLENNSEENIGEWTLYPLSEYGPLPESSFTSDAMPLSTYFVIFGFGKVWNNISGVREALGLPTWGEQGYTLVVQSASGYTMAFTLPDGRLATRETGQNAHFNIKPYYSSLGTPYLQIPPTLVMMPLTPTIPAPRPSATPEFHFLQPSPTWTPYAPSPATVTLEPTLSNAIYQSFEHGFMVRNTAMNCVYAYSEQTQRIILGPNGSYHYCIEFDALPDNPVNEAYPTGLITPSGSFGKVWSNYPAIRESLGYATSHELSYSGGIPPVGMTYSGGPFETPQVPLPDGRVLYCGMRAATAGSCSIR